MKCRNALLRLKLILIKIKLLHIYNLFKNLMKKALNNSKYIDQKYNDFSILLKNLFCLFLNHIKIFDDYNRKISIL
jgi:hypothetical protein